MADEVDPNNNSPEHLREEGDLEAFTEEAMASAVVRPITEEDLYHLLGCYPYLEICDASLETLPRQHRNPTIVPLKNGWPLHDYGHMLRTGQTELMSLLLYHIDPTQTQVSAADLLKHHDASQSPKRLASHRPAGTIVQQFFDAAFETMSHAMARWDATRVVKGYYPMQRAAWIAADTHDYAFQGFEPTPEDYVVLAWAKQLTPNQIAKVPKPARGVGV